MSSDWSDRYLAALEKGSPLTTSQAAKYLGVSTRTLEGWRKSGDGPAWRYRYVAKGSGPVIYERGCLDAWLPGGIAEYYTTAEVAHILGRSKRTLENWRAEADGPPWLRISDRLVLYPKMGVLSYKPSMIAGTPQYSEVDSSTPPLLEHGGD